ncbi:DUF4350 domain-containing protein [Deminuibacter soli]|nr:DUF4350 domain-containing protein [Deminuibacter soli]
MKKQLIPALLVWLLPVAGYAQQTALAQPAAEKILALPATPVADKDACDLILQGMEAWWYATGDGRYYQYIEKTVDAFVNGNTTAGLPGRAALTLYNVTGKIKYYNAARARRMQTGNAWQQQAFVAAYSNPFHQDTAFDGIGRSLLQNSKTVTRLRNTSDAARYGAVLIDVLEQFPGQNAQRAALLQLLKQTAALWSATRFTAGSCALQVYMLAKGVRLGLLPQSYLVTAQQYGAAIAGQTPGGDDNTKAFALGAYLLAGTELELAAVPKTGSNKTILLDSYFNNEHRNDTTGANTSFHYKWEEMDNNGFYAWGNIFRATGAQTHTLYISPDAATLQQADVYIIVDPDTKAESPMPNYMTPEAAQHIYDWVNKGGVLVMMMNDSANTEFDHFNILSEKFGIHFNKDVRNKVAGRQYETGQMDIPQGDSIFTTARRIYMKEICTQTLQPPAKAHFTRQGDVLVSVAKVGKGTVFAVDDPWLYNEYTDGRNAAADADNFKAAQDLARWLLQQVPASK